MALYRIEIPVQGRVIHTLDAEGFEWRELVVKVGDLPECVVAARWTGERVWPGVAMQLAEAGFKDVMKRRAPQEETDSGAV